MVSICAHFNQVILFFQISFFNLKLTYMIPKKCFSQLYGIFLQQAERVLFWLNKGY